MTWSMSNEISRESSRRSFAPQHHTRHTLYDLYARKVLSCVCSDWCSFSYMIIIVARVVWCVTRVVRLWDYKEIRCKLNNHRTCIYCSCDVSSGNIIINNNRVYTTRYTVNYYILITIIIPSRAPLCVRLAPDEIPLNSLLVTAYYTQI